VPPPLAPTVTLSPTSLTFSSQIVGTMSSAQAVTLTNSGTAPLSITSISIAGTNSADFAETSTCGSSVAVGANCSISVTFTPSAAGSRTGSVSISDNAANTPQTVSLTGTGQASGPAVSLSPSSLTFSSEPVGTTSAPQSVTLTNSGNLSLIITNISASGDFAETNNCAGSVAAGANCTISVTFTPTAGGSQSGSVNITDNAANTPQTVTLTGAGQVNNSAPVTVDSGPAGNDADVLFVTVTVCVPGTQTCQTIDHVSVDTGSSGLRILSSQLNISLPQELAGTGSPLGNCGVFADGTYVWGPVVTADVQIAGENAPSVPIQVISTDPNGPSPCNNPANADNTTATLGANALIGVSVFRQDCGAACSSNSPPPVYFSCPASGCTVTSEPLLGQLQNPVWMFQQDNNGLLITLPAIPDTGTTTVDGTMTFGIGTQSDNALGSATVYTTSSQGNFGATYGNRSFTSYIDAGSNGLFVLDAATLGQGMADCTGIDAGWYCPPSTTSFTFTNTGANNASGPVTIKIANTDSLFNSNFSAFDDLGGSNTGIVDYGLPFFFGRTIFVGIEGQSPNGTYWAY